MPKEVTIKILPAEATESSNKYHLQRTTIETDTDLSLDQIVRTKGRLKLLSGIQEWASAFCWAGGIGDAALGVISGIDRVILSGTDNANPAFAISGGIFVMLLAGYLGDKAKENKGLVNQYESQLNQLGPVTPPAAPSIRNRRFRRRLIDR